MRIPPGGGPPEVFARGVRNGTGLAVAPDGAVWTAVNNRDNIEYPFDAPYGDARESSQGEVIVDYVNDHPAEELAKLTPGPRPGLAVLQPRPGRPTRGWRAPDSSTPTRRSSTTSRPTPAA